MNHCWKYELSSKDWEMVHESADLQECVYTIYATVRTGEDGLEAIQVSISLLSSFSTSTPSVEAE
jgi:hypothetical protein